MCQYTASDLLLIIGAMFTGLTSLVTVALQLWGNMKTEQAKRVSADNGQQIKAVVAQTNEIARATPLASTTPTDSILAANIKANGRAP